MKRVLLLAMPWLILLGGSCSKKTPAAVAGATGEVASFSSLLDRLPPGADLIVLLDISAQGRVFERLLDGIEKVPLVADNPELMKLWKMQRKMLDGMLATAPAKLGLDPLHDLGRAALGVWLKPDRDPELAAVVTGKFPADLPRRFMPEATPRTIDKHQVWDVGEGMGLVVENESLLLLAKISVLPQLMHKKDSLKSNKLHQELALPFPKGFLVRISFALPEWLRTIDEPQAPMMTTLGGLSYLMLDVGDDVFLKVRSTTQRAAENVHYLLAGMREMMIGGRYIFRAYAYFALGLDLGQMAGIPEPFRSALQNRSALLDTMNKYLGPVSAKPEVKVDGLAVTLRASQDAMTGSAFVVGILAAIAIPAFIRYIRLSKASEAQAMLAALKIAEDTYRLDSGSYLACGPHPTEPPAGEAVDWGKDACFDKLGFDPGSKVNCSYQAALMGETGLLLKAACDLDGDGNPMIWVLKSGDATPLRATPEDVW